jgi:AcrR family transcriptional regulator
MIADARNMPTRNIRASDKKQERRQAIVTVATRLFAEYGYADCDMDRVASELKIAKGTLYLYFKGKELLFFACVDAGMQQLQKIVQQAAMAKSDPLERIGEAIRAYLQFFAQHTELTELFIQERANFKQRKRPSYFEHRDNMRGPWRELYLQLQRDGVIRNDIPTERILDTLGSLVYGTMFTNFFVGCSSSLDEQFHSIFAILKEGILAKSTRTKKSPRK